MIKVGFYHYQRSNSISNQHNVCDLSRINNKYPEYEYTISSLLKKYFKNITCVSFKQKNTRLCICS